MSDEEGEKEGIDPEIFDEQIDNYFSTNNNELLSYEKLDDFLISLDIYDQWNSEEEKDDIWQSFMKYGKDEKVDSEGTKKGMHDFLLSLNQGGEKNNDDNNDNDNNKEIKENKEENLLTRISRLSIRNDGAGTVNKLVLKKYKQKAIEEYECLDSFTLFQFKNIFSLLNINENNKNIIPVERIEQIINNNKKIKLDKNEVIKYIHFLSCDGKSIEEITSININNTIFSEINSLIEDKLSGEDLAQFEEDEEDEEENQEEPLDILEEILQKVELTKNNSLELKEMNNNMIKINKNFSETVTKVLQENNEENKYEYINHIEELGNEEKENMEKFNEYLESLSKDQKMNIKKIRSLKKSIVSFNNEMNKLKGEYNDILEKYNNNQEINVDDQMERLADENTALDMELKAKREEISELVNERAEKDKQISDLYIQLEESQKNEKDLKKQVSELKLAAAKSKEEYDNLMDNVLSQMQKKENEEMMERNRIKEMLEKQLKNDGDKQGEKFDINALNEIDNMNIPLTDKLMKKKKILSQLNNEQLIEYTLKLERLNINLKSEKNKKDLKIKELEEKLNQTNKALSNSKKQVGSLNIEIKKLQKKINDLHTEVKTNEVFRPSIAMNSQMRMSRISKLNTPGLNAMKFEKLKAENKIKNSNDYFKNMGMNIGGKKQIKTVTLKDKNINQKSNKNQNTNLSPQNIMNSIYGEEEKKEEGKNEDENEKNQEKELIPNPPNKKKSFEISKNDENNIDGQKNAFNNLEQNGIEFNIQSGVDIVNDEGGEIVIDNINDINLGGSTKELFEIKEEENAEENEDKDDKKDSQNAATNAFFESKPAENNFEISGEKKEEQSVVRETIQVNSNNQMAFGGLEDMILGVMGNNEEEEQEEDNLGRISEHNSEIKNENQMSNYGFDIKDKKRKKSAHENNIKSSGDITQGMNSKYLLEELANTIDDNLEINNDNQININNEDQKKNNLEINSNKLQISKTKKGAEFDISENNINITNKSKEKEKNNLEISNSNKIIVDSKNDPNSSSNKNKIEISSQNNNSIKINPNKSNQFSVQHSLDINIEDKQKRKNTKLKKAQIENNNYDYYSLFHEDFVLRKLRELKDDGNEKNIYSDQIYLLTNGRKLEKRLIMLTPSHIFIIEPKEAQFVLIMEKKEINKIAISNQNLNILILLRNKGENVIFLTLRRMDLLNFIKRYYHESQKPIRFTYEDSFKLLIKGKETVLSVKDKIFTTLSNFDGAIKIGYLQKMNPLFFKTFSEKLVVLTSIGLILFNDPNKPPERLYPIIGSKITKALGNKYKRQNCFEILTPNGETKVFSAYKERELNSWMEEFEKVKKDFSNKMKKLDTVNKLEFIDNKNNLYNVQEEEDEEEEIIPDNK